MPFLILLGLFLLVGVQILAIAAFVRVQRLQESVDQLRQLFGRLAALEQKLARLEESPSMTGGAPAAPKTASAATLPAPQPPKQEPLRTPSPSAAPPKPPIATPARPVSSTPALSYAQVVGSTPAHAESTNFEALVAGRWMNYVGILALLFGVAFFLKYAFENNWVGPRGRVAIGLLAGSALFPWSHRLLEKDYRYFSEGIAGLGAAILYLSLWAGWHYYHAFSQSTAFVLMIVVTAFTSVVAVGRNSERIAVLALLGGALTPQLVSTGENHEVVLFTYMAVLGAGMLGLARAREWKSLPPIQFIATLVYFWGWYSEFYRDDELATTIIFATVFFILFAALPVARSWREGELSMLEAGIVLVNSGGYLVALRTMLWPQYRWGLTVAAVALAAVHLAAERVLPEKHGTDQRIARILYAGLALTFVTLAIPIRLDGKWLTIGWAVEGAVLIWSGLRIRIAALRYAGFVLFMITACRLAIISIPAGQFLLNARFATFVIAVGCFLASCYFARTEGAQLEEQEQMVFLGTAIAANILALAALSLEVWDLFQRMPSLGIDAGLAQELGLSMLWLVYALSLLVAGLWRKSAVLRWQALTLLGIVIVKVFIFDLSSLERFYRIVSFILLGLALLMISFYYQRRLSSHKNEEKP
ncbi:MAG: DUF2339 domain-containing protein [Candidatus Acidiferrales bacterium]